MAQVGLTSEGVRPNDESEGETRRALCLSHSYPHTKRISRCGGAGHDRTSLLLPDNQTEYIEAVAAAAASMKIPLTVVVMGGGPVDISAAKGSPHVGAIMWCASLALAPSPLISLYKSEKSLCGTGAATPGRAAASRLQTS